MKNITLPPKLSSYIGSESKDFVVKAGRSQPLKKSFSLILFGSAWTLFTMIFFLTFLGPVLQGKEVSFKSNGVPTTVGPDNLWPLLLPAGIIVLFILIGIGMLSLGIYLAFKKGGYFVGTPTRLIHFQDGNIKSIDWEQFSGYIEVSGNNQKGNISLHMRTGRMVSKNNGPDKFVPDVIYISDIPNVYEIEQICRRRIKENDPTPSKTEHNTT